MPVALVLWLLWRILQSVDQVFYWSLLVFLTVAWLVVRLLNSIREADVPEETSSILPNSTLERISYWRNSIEMASRRPGSETLEQALGWKLAALYTAGQPDAAPYEIYDDLKQGKLSLPEPIYAFLFPPEPSSPRRTFRQILSSIRDLPRKHARRWTGREMAEYYQALDQVLKFIESLRENKYDDEHFDPARD